MTRQSEVKRETKETSILVKLCLDGTGTSSISTGIGFMDHMLDHLAKHSGFDIDVKADGDLEIDAHHTVEDLGICLGKAFADAVGNAEGIRRYGHAVVPMDEVLAEVTVDWSGRPFLAFRADIPRGRVGELDSELVEEFFRAFAMNCRVTVHVDLRHGDNVHHSVEGIFKAFARSLAEAVGYDEGVKGIPSTKGLIDS